MKKARYQGKPSIGTRFSLPREEQDPFQAIAVNCYANKQEQETIYMDELVSLAESCEITVVEKHSWLLRAPSSSTYFNRGKIEELQEILYRLPTIGTLLIDDEITASQQRNLEKKLGVIVIDRTELILEIFADRALTAEAGIQVKLAQARYLLPRLKRMWGHLSRQKSGGGSFVKGEGEKQIELDRRIVKDRIYKLSRDLKEVEKHRREQRKVRKRRQIPTFALIGYTNSGKSTLLNQLTEANTYVEDKLFATLDPKTRWCQLPGGQKVLVTDTVGFIRKLPHALVAAFKSTLEAAIHENVLLHVVDASHPLALEHVATTSAIINELGVSSPKIITVLNKVDILPGSIVPAKLRLLLRNPILVSAKTGMGISDLLTAMAELVHQDYRKVTLVFSYQEFQKFAELRDLGLVISHQYQDNVLIVETYLPKELEKHFENNIRALDD